MHIFLIMKGYDSLRFPIIPMTSMDLSPMKSPGLRTYSASEAPNVDKVQGFLGVSQGSVHQGIGGQL